MSTFKTPDEIAEVLSAPLGDIITSVGESVAHAQQALDQQAIETFKLIYGSENENLASELRSIGYQPTWYQIPEASAEISIALTTTGSQIQSGNESKARSRFQMLGSPLNASYTNKYDYQLKASSTLKFKVVPIPAPMGATNMRVTPKVLGFELAAAIQLLDELNISYKVEGEVASDKEIKTQNPQPGEIYTDTQVMIISTLE